MIWNIFCLLTLQNAVDPVVAKEHFRKKLSVLDKLYKTNESKNSEIRFCWQLVCRFFLIFFHLKKLLNF